MPAHRRVSKKASQRKWYPHWDLKDEEKAARKDGREEASSRESSPCWTRASCWRPQEKMKLPGYREVEWGRKEAGEVGRGPSSRVMLKSLNLVVRVMGNTETRDMIRFMLWKEHPGCGVEKESEAWWWSRWEMEVVLGRIRSRAWREAGRSMSFLYLINRTWWQMDVFRSTPSHHQSTDLE